MNKMIQKNLDFMYPTILHILYIKLYVKSAFLRMNIKLLLRLNLLFSLCDLYFPVNEIWNKSHLCINMHYAVLINVL